ncbi:aminotransferase class III-fold pyridoxal phosphate-dependent enzyme [Gulosibacter chungangensis]|uniref:(S)-3-amino-2-methylpropionate transaminase n=1 Tax=Gulosibacter chungangensis TaxID=979746 RepID=A0A7J5B9N6_9MICO|nr:aminotransferase class III-fold pyridoxal phosphate-dependent enzyme [Gulosibacter chungangensis]KAB1642546.1 aminotransferase class III-fold pyridoxal phosphate-dependent enzyme [Gulosibacter chungangensis]
MTTTTTSRRIRTEIPGPRSKELAAAKEQYVSSSVNPATPMYIESASGSILTDVDGNEFIDFASGIGVTSLGHVNPEAIAAAIEQTQKVTHTLFSVSPYESYVEVSRRLAELTPGDFAKKSALSSTGAEAIENAVKIARAYTRRNGIAVVDHGYHGRTNLTLGLNYKAQPYSAGVGPRPGEIYRAANSYPFIDGLDGVTAARRAIAHLEKISGADNLACLVIEPIQGEGGVIIPAEGYLTTLQEWAAANGIVTIADEIQTGLGRTGTMFASEHFGFVPDLVVTAKAIGAGFPLSAVTGRAEIMDAIPAGGLSGTFSGNPVACAAALKIFDQLEAPGTLERAVAVGERIQAGLRALKERFAVIGDVRGLGGLHGIELVDADGAPNAAAFKQASRAAYERGLLVLPGGSDGHVLRLLPAINISDALIDEALEILEEAFATVK